MAIVDEATFQTNIATAAAALTTALTDDTVTRTALEISNPMHPLRQIEKLFNYNPSSGVVTADDDYSTAAYAGKTPSKGNPFDVVSEWQALTLISAAVADLAPADIVVTFNRDVANASGIQVFRDGVIETGVVVTIVDEVVTIVVSSDFVNGEVIALTGDFRTADNANLSLAQNAVVNNVA